MEYVELTLSLTPRLPWSDILVAELAELGYESFVETEDGIQAYAPANLGDPVVHLRQTSLTNHPEVEVSHSIKLIPHQNWNALWESDFKPVVVSAELAILAPFHDVDSFSQRLKIIIQPQMSFGTGHHQTTFLMSEFLLEHEDFSQPVLDMGTGTGVLAFLSEKLGAERIVAVDIEPWSVENTVENAERNGCTHIEALCGDVNVLPDLKYGTIIANINKNVLKSHLPTYAEIALPGAVLYLSGFFASDVDELISEAQKVGFEYIRTKELETWAALQFKRV